MSATGVNVFDKTLQTTNIWLDEIMEELGPDRQLAWHILGAVLRALRDRLPADLAAHLSAQLPLLVRGTYYDRYRPADLPNRSRSLDELLSEVSEELRLSRPVDSRDAVRVVGAVLIRHVDGGQLAKVLSSLPEEIRNLTAAEATS
jgi:uncharacterized protein (DUF2267 family)